MCRAEQPPHGPYLRLPGLDHLGGQPLALAGHLFQQRDGLLQQRGLGLAQVGIQRSLERAVLLLCSLIRPLWGG